MAVIRIGSSGLVAQPTAYSFTPAGGQIATYRWVGKASDVATEYNTQIGDEKEAQINPLSGGLAELVVSVPTGVQQSWDLDIQWNDRPVAQSSAYRTWFEALTDDATRFQFLSDCEWIRSGNATTSDPAGWGTADSTYKAFAWDIVNDATIQEPSAVLRRTISWPAGDSGTTVNWTDVKKVWTTSQITSLTDPPPSICGTLPTANWLMLSDSAEYGADGRFTASTIWVSGTYPTHLYTYK